MGGNLDSPRSRRAFLRRGGTALGAGVAATAGLGGATAQAGPLPASAAEDREAIHRLHRDFMAGTGAVGAAVSYRPRLAAEPDRVTIAPDGRTAQAVFHVEAETVIPLEGDSTLVQMARLQGHVAGRRIEAGRIEAGYVKQGADWRITTLRFVSA